MSRLRAWLYARLEEMSFRSGATVAAAVLVLVAAAITLAIMPGHHQAVPRAAGAVLLPGSPVLSAPASAPSPARPAPSASDRGGSAAPGRDNLPDAAVGLTAAPRATSAPPPPRRPGSAEPAWLQTRWPAAGPPPAWMLPWPWDQMLPWPWDQRWTGQQWPWRHRGQRPPVRSPGAGPPGA